MACFFLNGLGDVPNTVHICSVKEAMKKLKGKFEFLGHFTVKKGQAHLSASDCNDIPVASFRRGRWFVYLADNAVFVITKEDSDTHC